MELLWITLESETTENSLKQHAFVPKISKGGNKRNVSLCGKFKAIADDAKPEMFENLLGENLYLPNVCKSCLKIYNKMKDKIK